MEEDASTEEWLKRHAPIGGGATLADGAVVGRWRIVAFVARGGSGEVYRAVEEHVGLAAALKILHREDTAARERFAREVRVLSQLRNRAFPVLFESGELAGRPWYATEFLQPLEMPTSDRAVARLVLAVCRGAGALHALGYVHRDIKPANILSRNGEPVLIDLGLLKETEAPALHSGGTVSVVDGRPVGVGTPGYAAPEQFIGGEISPVTDIHAIGVLASACFGRRPPRAWRTIIRRATSSIPQERYPNVASLARAVRCRHLPSLLGAAAAVVASISLAALWTSGGRMAMQGPKPATAQATEPPAGATPTEETVAVVESESVVEQRPVEIPEPVVEQVPVTIPDSNATLAPRPVGAPPQAVPEPTLPRPVGMAVIPEPTVSYPVGTALQAAPKSSSANDGDAPIVASPRLRQKLSDQGRNLPNVTPNQIRNALAELEAGMVPIPGRNFEMCKFEMTQAIWEPIAGFNPSKDKGPDLPVSNVTMADIEEFLRSLNDLPEVRASGKKYRLPTADEWEYACLAGGINGFCCLGDGTQISAETLGEVAWHGSNSKDRPHPVCMKKPNAFGLYDMHGNVAEWTSTKPPGEMFEYICKGNAYNGKKLEAFRADFSPAKTYGLSFYSLGFRLAR